MLTYCIWINFSKRTIKIPIFPHSELKNSCEKELLLRCLQTCINSENAEQIYTLLKQKLNWDYLIRTATQHGVMPLLYWNLNQICPQAVPPNVLAQLQDGFYANGAENLFLAGELLNLLKLLSAHEIPAIPFKGPVLAASIYGNLAFRPCGDLDILVHEKDFLKTKELLISQGYILVDDLLWQSQLVSEDGRVNIDLHQSLTPKDFPFPLNFECLWERLQLISLAGKTVLSLSPEDLLLTLCTNVARDCWQERERLTQICDIAELLRVYPAMDWEYLLEESDRLGCKRILFLGLFLASDLLGAAIPEQVLPKIQVKPVVKTLAEQVCEWLFRESDSPSRGMKKAFFYFKVRERLRDKIPYLIHLAYLWIAPSQADRAFLPLPDSLSFLYYWVRPIRLINESKLRLLQHLNKVLNLLRRRVRARKLGIEFNRAADFHLPQKIRVGEKYQPVSFPSEKGMAGEFIEVLLDDCYGLENLSGKMAKILDIGAHVGLFSVAARNRFPQAVIHAYEPNKNLEKHLKNQAQIANFEYFMEAVGLEEGNAVINVDEVSAKTRSYIDETGNIPMVSLLTAIARLGGFIDLVKVDCEGAEWLLFQDRAAWQSVQNLSLEYHLWPSHTEDSLHTEEEIRSLIENLGFKITKQVSIDEWYGLIHASR